MSFPFLPDYDRTARNFRTGQYYMVARRIVKKIFSDQIIEAAGATANLDPDEYCLRKTNVEIECDVS